LDSRNFLRITQQRTRIEEKKKIEIELDKHFKIGVQYTDQKKKKQEREFTGSRYQRRRTVNVKQTNLSGSKDTENPVEQAQSFL
jgi:hypothetical protein